MFFFLSFWYCMLLFAVICSIFSWMIDEIIDKVDVDFVYSQLKLTNEDSLKGFDSNTLSLFVYNYLGKDGVFVLKSIVYVSGNVFAVELISKLWGHYAVDVINMSDNKDKDKVENNDNENIQLLHNRKNGTPKIARRLVSSV